MIDNNILSKSEIISYLDFFINQRAGRSNMELAISKWEQIGNLLNSIGLASIPDMV